MKTLLLCLLVLNFTTAFAGNGVVVGDGHPVELTEQERLTSTGAEIELAEVVEKLTLVHPIAAHLLNVGLRGINDKKIILMKIRSTSHDHYAFIEDVKLTTYYNGIYTLEKNPTIYFYENYFSLKTSNPSDLKEVTKVKILIHEFMHMYLGESELKVQRVTDLIYKISVGQFTNEDLNNLSKELNEVIGKLSERSEDLTSWLICRSAFDINYKKIYQDYAFPVLSEKTFKDFNTFTPGVQDVVRNNIKVFLNTPKYKSYCFSEVIQFTDWNLEQLTHIDFLELIINSIIGEGYTDDIKPPLNTEQLNEIKNLQFRPSDLNLTVGFRKQNFSNKYDVTMFFELINDKVELQKRSILKISDFSNVANLKIIYESYKHIFSIIGQGSMNRVKPLTATYKVKDVPYRLVLGTFALSEAGELNVFCYKKSLGNCKGDITKDTANDSVTVTSTQIIYHSKVMNVKNNVTENSENRETITFKTEIEVVE